MGSLASISKENAGKGTVDQADSKIDDPNDVMEITDGLQIKKQADVYYSFIARTIAEKTNL